MKKHIVFTVLAVSLAFSAVGVYGQAPLSGTYRCNDSGIKTEFTFTGNNFRGSNAFANLSGTYSLSGSRLTMNITRLSNLSKI